MDSGNSGSLQSSSGGDEEYDSRSDSFSAFLGGGGGGGVGPPPPPPSNHHHHHLLHNNNNQSTLFDSLYFDPFARSPPPDTRLYSDPISSTLLSPPTHRPINPLPQPPPPPPPPPSSAAPPPQPSRNAKKRSRASRRAPTTVLTTDTSNFRAMVQEFTGIPAQPFSAAAAAATVFPRGGRFDLFSAVRSESPFLLRPFAQKAQTIPSSFTATTTTTTTTSTAAAATTTANPNSGSNNYQLSWASQNQDLLNMHNQMFSLQSLLQQPNHPNLPVFGSSSSSKSMSEHPPPQQQQLKMGEYMAGSSSSAAAAAAPSEFHPQKAGAEMGSSRVPGEGMVDSWICSSD